MKIPTECMKNSKMYEIELTLLLTSYHSCIILPVARSDLLACAELSLTLGACARVMIVGHKL